MGQTARRFRRHEVVRVLETPATKHHMIAGLLGVIVQEGERNWEGRWHYSVRLPRHRHRQESILEDELESTGQWAPPPEPERQPASLRLRVEPDTGEGEILDHDGDPIDFDIDNGGDGLAFFTCVHILDPDLGEDEDFDQGIVVAKAQRPDGTWRYGILHDEDRRIDGHDRADLDPSIWTDPLLIMDRPRPGGIDTFERSEALPFVAVWKARRPAFGYDQGVRVLDRAHTAGVAGREGAVGEEFLSSQLTWSYFVLFDDFSADGPESATVDEVDLEPTDRFGDGYNPPPDWLD